MAFRFCELAQSPLFYPGKHFIEIDHGLKRIVFNTSNATTYGYDRVYLAV
jgi:hypothetical protein